MAPTYEGNRQRNLVCPLGFHKWRAQSTTDGFRYMACVRCHRVDDGSASIIPPGV